MTAVTLMMALLLDRWWGEPQRFHPLVGFGNTATRLQQRLNRLPCQPQWGRLLGAVALLLVVLPLPLILWLLLPQLTIAAEWALTLIVIYLTLGARSLAEHAQAVAEALRRDDLSAARQRVGYIVSRDTQQMDEAAVSRAAMESVLENGNDAIFGVLFWFAVGGLPAVVIYRLVNTLDAMWGYRTPQYRYFGWAAARLDDLLNWPVARLTALGYALMGQGRLALQCWQRQGHLCESPNAGPVMAAGAGALACQLGGGAWYHGGWVERPLLGCGVPPSGEDIGRAVALVQRSMVLWVVVIGLIEGLSLA